MSNTITETIPALRANLDVTELEAKVLIPVFLGGNMTAGAVALVSEETITKVERALNRLQKKGLVTKIDGVVPIYRPVPLGLTFSERLGTLVTDVNGFAESSYESLDTDIEATSETASSVVKQAEKSSKRIESDLSSCEDEMLEAVKSQTETVSEIARASLEEFSNSMESALSEIDVTMEESLGDNMSQLHAELDKGQQEIEQDVERISTELEQELEERKASAVDSVKVFREDADRLLEIAESAVADAVSESTDIICKASKKTSEQLTNDTTQLSQEVVERINRASADLNDTVDKMDRDISIAHDEAQEALSKLVIDTRSMTHEHAQLARDKIQSTLRESRAMNEAFGAWREEVATYMDSASRSMRAQLDKVESADKNYIDALQTTISGHLDKVDSVVGEEYTDLKEISSAVETNFSEFVEETKTTLLSFLRKRLKESRQNLDSGRAKLEDDLEEMVAETTEAIDTRLSETANQVGEVLVTRENELKTLTEKTQNEITSTFGTVVTNASNKNDAILTDINTTAQRFESNLHTHISEVTSQFATSSQEYVDEVEVLYEILNQKLDERLAETVQAMNSHVSRARSEIESIIEDQISRIDNHAMGIKDEFHSQLDEITQQFITLTEGLETTFNGLVTSQVIETRDFVSSTHTEFNTALKREMTGLKETSMKLQQEYSSEIGQRLDLVRELPTDIQTKLDEFTQGKKQEMSRNIKETVQQLESAMDESVQSLREMRDGPIVQINQELETLSGTFGESLEQAGINVEERVANLSEATASEIERSSKRVQNLLATAINQQSDSDQRLLTEASKQLDIITSDMTKKSSERMDSYESSLAKAEREGLKERRALGEEILSSMNQRRTEVSTALAGAGLQIDSSITKVLSSLNSLEENITGEIESTQEQLGETAIDIGKSLSEMGDEHADQLETLGTKHLKETKESLRSHATEFEATTSTKLNESRNTVDDLPQKLSNIVDESFTSLVNKTNSQCDTVLTKLGEEKNQMNASKNRAIKEYRDLLDQTTEQTSKKSGVVFDKALESLIETNLYASRKFESLGLELKTKLSQENHRVMEDVRSNIAETNTEITECVTEANNAANKKKSNIRRARNEAVNALTSSIEKESKRWQTEREKQVNSLRQSLDTTIEGMTHVISSAIDGLETLTEAGQKLSVPANEKTWYVSGDEEIQGYLHGMIGRAKESVLVSVDNPASLDSEVLSKVKAPGRRILVLPESADVPHELEEMEGWRIWRTRSPALLATIDSCEILLAGSRKSCPPIALVSQDKAYLQLFHDVIGPRIIENRIREES